MHAATVSTDVPAPVRFNVRHQGRSMQLNYQQVFAIGYAHWFGKRFSNAARFFESLTTISDRGPRAHIMLAHCKAMFGDYSGCCSTLSRVLTSDDVKEAAIDLHEVFVMWKCGFYLDSKNGLRKVISEHRELPTPCLILAGLITQYGKDVESIPILKLAINRDRPDGAIATIARRKLSFAMTQLS